MGLFSFLESSSSSTSETNSKDASFVAGNNSTNNVSHLDVKGSGNTVTATDHGAVSGGLALAMKGIEGAQQLAQQAQGQTGDLMAGIFKEHASQSANLTQAVVDLKTSDTRTLVIAGMAMVGIVAFQFLKSRAA